MSGEGEDESLSWSYRFPGPCFSICPRYTITKSMNMIKDEGFVEEFFRLANLLLVCISVTCCLISTGGFYCHPHWLWCLIDRLADGCTEGLSCDFAHSEEELQEWHRRRDFLRRRLDKARADMLISPTDNDFGIYNFLLQN